MSHSSNSTPTARRTGAELSDSDRHDLLSSARRRTVIDVVGAHGRVVSLDDLTAQVAARENGGSAVDDQTLDRVRLSLYHKHLPKLAANAVVGFDPDANLVAARDDAAMF